MRKKIKFVSFYVCSAIIFTLLSANTYVKTEEEDRYNKILHTIGYILKTGHYSPQVVNDAFSEKVFNYFIKSLDPEKLIFLEKDINYLKLYFHEIDEEINGSQVTFFYKTNEIYKERIARIAEKHVEFLEKPLHFLDKDSIITIYDQRQYANNEKNQLKQWNKKMKYLSLGKYVELLNIREKSTIDTVKNKTDKDLEFQARNFTKKVMGKTFDKISRKTTDDDRFSLFINAITNEMDPHTDYFMPIAKRAWDEGITGKFYGIGALIGEQNGYVKIETVTQGGPAWKTGEVNDGDLILKIEEANKEPVDVAGFDTQEAIKLIRGNMGTTVTITFKKTDGTIKTVAIVREELKIDETFAKSAVITEGDKKMGYIYLPKFYSNFGNENGRSCKTDVALELKKLQNEDIEGIVIDLRNNGGGSLQEVVDMVGLFIPEGPVVQVKNGDGRSSLLADRDQGKVFYSGPLVVMINEFSASASEIFAAAIQDYKRGVIVGSNSSYGKGSVQRPIPLNRNNPDFGSIHLTIQKYYRINGSSVQLKGVVPDIILPGYYQNFKIKEKDKKSALAWDETTKLTYKPWALSPNYENLKIKFKARYDSSAILKKIDENSLAIANEVDSPDYLNITTYTHHEKMVKERATTTREMYKINKEMNIKILNETAKTDSLAGLRNSRFVNFIKQDFYLKEATNIITDMAISLNMSKFEPKLDIEKKEN